MRRILKNIIFLWKAFVFHARDRWFAATLPFREAAGLRTAVREQGGAYRELGWLAVYAPPARANAWLKAHPRYLGLTKASKDHLAAFLSQRYGGSGEKAFAWALSLFEELPEHIREHFQSARLPKETCATIERLGRHSVESIYIVDNPAGLAYETFDDGKSFIVQKFERVDLLDYPWAEEAPVQVRRAFRLKELH
jgi:hypothetical protein